MASPIKSRTLAVGVGYSSPGPLISDGLGQSPAGPTKRGLGESRPPKLRRQLSAFGQDEARGEASEFVSDFLNVLEKKGSAASSRHRNRASSASFHCHGRLVLDRVSLCCRIRLPISSRTSRKINMVASSLAARHRCRCLQEHHLGIFWMRRNPISAGEIFRVDIGVGCCHGLVPG